MLARTVLVLATAISAASAQTLSEDSFDALLAAVLPGEDELAWREIPWATQLGEAALRADAAGRPILLWAMSGHPLGCT